jgi:hypothetical protein
MLAADDLHGCAPSFDPGESLPDRAEHLDFNAQLNHREVHRRLQAGADNSDKSQITEPRSWPASLVGRQVGTLGTVNE